MLPEQRYLQWRNGREVGCFFARTIAKHPDRFGQKIECIHSLTRPDEIAADIAARVDRMIADPAISAAVLVLPTLITLEETAATVLALSQQPGWRVEKVNLPKPPAADFVALRVTKNIPFADATCPSEAMVLGPFNDFPPTRQSPVVAFEIYVGEPRPFDPKDGIKPTTQANIAHIEMNLPTHRAFQKMWNRSVDGRALSLGGPDNRAKAKVSLVLPRVLAAKLGCVP